jgi:beta-galactosidase
MRSWGKGLVWVNGHNLGRYWNIGPQQTLYCPGVWLKAGRNEVMVLELLGADRRTVAGRREPILDELNPAGTGRLHRRPGQRLDLTALAPALSGAFAPGASSQDMACEPAVARYVCLEAINSYAEGGHATCATLQILGAEGQALASSAQRVAYASSEEVLAENGSASHVLDDNARSFWHTAWQGIVPRYPHQLVIDLGKEQVVTGIRYLPRQDQPNGRIRDYRLYLSAKPFTGL